MPRRPHIVNDLLDAFVGEVCPTQQQDGLNHPRREGTEGERRRQDEELVQEGTLGDGPQHGQLTGSREPDGFLCIDGEVVPQDAGRFFARQLRHDGHVVHQRGNVVEQCKESTGHEAKVLFSACHVLCLP